MKDSRSPKLEDAGLDLLEMLGNTEVKFTDKAFDTDSKEKFNSLCSKKKERSLHRYALAASLSLFVSVSVLFVLAFGNYGKKAKPESGNVGSTQEKIRDEIFAPIEGRVVITSGDMWNYYAARKAIYDSPLLCTVTRLCPKDIPILKIRQSLSRIRRNRTDRPRADTV